MKKETTILLAEDDEGHANLVIKNLKRSGIENEIIHFKDGEAILNYLSINHREEGTYYILLLDIRMPKVDGIEVLKQVKQDNIMSKLPVIMVTTTDNPWTVRKCHDMGCVRYVVKPVNHGEFVDTINELGQFLMTMDDPV